MTVEEHRVDADEIYSRCARCGHLGAALPTACTCINFRTRHAWIWLARDASQATLEHERAHARGYDDADGTLRRSYAAWKDAGGAAERHANAGAFAAGWAAAPERPPHALP